MKNHPLVLLFLAAATLLQAQALDTVTIPGSETTFQLALIPAGALLWEEKDGSRAELQLDAFWMGVHEVTYDEFALFQHREKDTDASLREEGAYSADAVSRPTPPYLDYTYGMGMAGGFPAVSMTQQAALRYCRWLYQKTGQFYRLPTEAEWTYACLAGREWQPGKEELDQYAWHYDNSYEKYSKTGGKAPNPWGLYDMLGNVAEWTLDHYEKDYLDAIGEETQNPWIEPTRRHSRTVKGGSYDSDAKDCSCREREKSQARWQARDPQIPKSIWWNTDSPFVGFRIVRPAQQPSAEAIEAFFDKAIKD
ncbi:MAG: SUMF1/EgtB/PvdO family nonheme iron enzyme [Phaeodactylibacter sp.]|nr:SUMF1/EgtB/PvdO family nonheme iron enzyme [Phaeodactylibacter sp.]